MIENVENNGTGDMGLVTPTPEQTAKGVMSF